MNSLIFILIYIKWHIYNQDNYYVNNNDNKTVLMQVYFLNSFDNKDLHDSIKQLSDKFNYMKGFINVILTLAMIYLLALHGIAEAKYQLNDRDKIRLDEVLDTRINSENAGNILDTINFKKVSSPLTERQNAIYDYIYERIYDSKLFIDCNKNYQDKELAKKLRIKSKNVIQLKLYKKLSNKDICKMSKKNMKAYLKDVKAMTIN